MKRSTHWRGLLNQVGEPHGRLLVGMGVIVLLTIGLTGCGGGNTRSAASQNVSPTPSLRKTIVAQQTEIAALRSSPTATPAIAIVTAVPTDTTIPIPTPSQTPDPQRVYPATIGPWVVKPVAVSIISDSPSAYSDVAITATILNTSNQLAEMPDDANNGVALQIQTDKGYLYPASVMNTDGRNPHFIEGLTPPGFEREADASFPLVENFAIPANAKPRALIATIGSVFGGGSVTWPLSKLPSSYGKPTFAYPATGYLHLGTAIKQGPLSLTVSNMHLQPSCYGTDAQPTFFWLAHFRVQLTNNYGYALQPTQVHFRLYLPDGTVWTLFGLSSDIAHSASVKFDFQNVDAGQVSSYDVFGPVHWAAMQVLYNGATQQACSNPNPPVPQLPFQLLVVLPPLVDPNTNNVIAQQAWGTYMIKHAAVEPSLGA